MHPLKVLLNLVIIKLKAMQPILLFDIDGTLMRVKKAFMRELILDVIQELEISEESVATTQFAGRTDKDIFSELVASHPQPSAAYDQLKEIYIGYMNTYFTHRQTEVIEGAEALIRFAEREGYRMGLCTGNYRETAFLKVNAAGLDNRFAFGGFGCNHRDRIHLPEEAHKEYMTILNGDATPAPSDYVVIGDTPNDVRCARYFGAKVVTVSTGDYSNEQLVECNPDLHVEDLREMIQWLEE